MGAGTGQFAVPAAQRFGRVIAVDVSPVMLTALQAKAAAGQASLECVRGGFLSFSPAGTVDGVYTRNALHQVPDFWKAIALRRMADMLRPGGVLRLLDLIYDFAPEEADAVFSDWFAQAAADPAAGYTAADYAEHIRTEYSTFRWLLEPLLAATGFEVTTSATAAACTAPTPASRSARPSRNGRDHVCRGCSRPLWARGTQGRIPARWRTGGWRARLRLAQCKELKRSPSGVATPREAPGQGSVGG